MWAALCITMLGGCGIRCSFFDGMDTDTGFVDEAEARAGGDSTDTDTATASTDTDTDRDTGAGSGDTGVEVVLVP